MTVDRFLYYGCLFLSALIALINIKALKSRQLLLFAPFLWLVLFQELCLVFIFPKAPTGIVYNISRPITTCFYAYIFYNIPFTSARHRRIIIWMIAGYLLLTACIYTFLQEVSIYNRFVSFAGGFTITCCAIFFLFDYYNVDDAQEEKKWVPVFWITCGIVLFFPMVNTTFGLYQYINKYNISPYGVKLYNIVPRVMSFFMYGTFAYAFYLCRKNN